MAASWAHSLHSSARALLRFAALLLVSLLFRFFYFVGRREEVADFEYFPDRGGGHCGGGGVACLGRAETPFRWAPTTLLPVVFFPCAHLSVQFPVLQALLLHPDLLWGRWENVAGRLRTTLRRSLSYQGFRGICFAVCCEMHGVHGLGHLGSFYFLRSDVTGAWETGRGRGLAGYVGRKEMRAQQTVACLRAAGQHCSEWRRAADRGGFMGLIMSQCSALLGWTISFTPPTRVERVATTFIPPKKEFSHFSITYYQRTLQQPPVYPRSQEKLFYCNFLKCSGAIAPQAYYYYQGQYS